MRILFCPFFSSVFINTHNFPTLGRRTLFFFCARCSYITFLKDGDLKPPISPRDGEEGGLGGGVLGEYMDEQGKEERYAESVGWHMQGG